MLELLVAASVALGASVDTTVSIERGERVSLENFSGRLVVRTWDRSEVRFESGAQGAGGAAGVRVVHSSGELSFRADRRSRERRATRRAIYSVRMPAWAPLEVRGIQLSMEIEGLAAGLSARSVEGDIRIRDVSGGIVARTVEGMLEVDNAEGTIELFSLDNDVWVSGTKGDLTVEAGDGDVHLLRIDARRVQASTVDGVIEFDGVIWPDGRYELTTHDGDVTLSLAENVSASVSVSMFDGEFTTEFPVVLSGLNSSRELRFSLGAGEASIIVRAFDGEVRLVRSR